MMNNQDQDNSPHVRTIREILGIPEEDFVFSAIPPVPSLPVAEAPQLEADTYVPPVDLGAFKSRNILSRDWVKYPLIFFVALGFFYLVLNFRAITTQVANKIIPAPKNEEAVLGATSPDYNSWISKYYVHVNDQQVLGPNEDADSDGLTNTDEFYLNTNPLEKDTDSDGYDDGQEILNGYNPLYDGRLRAYQEDVIRDHLDIGVIQARKNYSGSLWIDRFQTDPSKPGRVEIPKLGVDVPVIWSKEFSQMENDLKYGAAHHPETPYPGDRGTVSIHGHSSGNPGDGNFKTAFTKLNFLEPGDDVFVTVNSTTGDSRRYRYVVRKALVFAKSDQVQFADLNGFFLNLSTSWPIGTAHQRYVVTTELVGL